MITTLASFHRKKDFLICVDSDGCAIDSMNIKHFHCFGPCVVKQWHLERWEERILHRWNTMNLYTMTRGINRFQGLEMILREINETICPIEGLHALSQWVITSPALSEDALRQAISQNASPCLQNALEWSVAVNKSIRGLPAASKKAFEGVDQALCHAHSFADIVVVSSANRDAVLDEWTGEGLLNHVDLILTQDTGSKQFCIVELLKRGYVSSHVLMVGDAPGDLKAAQTCGVWFYPILVNQEHTSWKEFEQVALAKFEREMFSDYAAQKQEEFLKNLGGHE